MTIVGMVKHIGERSVLRGQPSRSILLHSLLAIAELLSSCQVMSRQIVKRAMHNASCGDGHVIIHK